MLSCSLHLFSQWLEDSVKSVLVFTLTPNVLCLVSLGKCVSIKIPCQRSFINHLSTAVEAWPLALCPHCPANASPFRQLPTIWGCLPMGYWSRVFWWKQLEKTCWSGSSKFYWKLFLEYCVYWNYMCNHIPIIS